MNHNWVKKKQGDPVLGKPIDFKVVVDEWINLPPDIIDMEGVEGSNKKNDSGSSTTK